MGLKSSPVILMMVAFVCAIMPAGLGAMLLPPSAFAQQEIPLGEEGNLAGGIVSNVLDGSSGGNDDEDDNDSNDEQENGDDSTAGDDTNRQIAVPIITQDQREANLAEQLGLDADIVEEIEEEEVTPTPTPTPTPEEEDTTPPTLTVPGDITEEATSPNGAVVTFEVTAQDTVDGSVPVTCTPASGSTFPIGDTVVECTATDAAGNTATASFMIIVQDTTAPVITVPGDITEEATSPNGAVVTFEVTAQDTVDGSVPVTCTPASGSTFPIDTTTVNCEATDAAGNTATASFTVTVIPLFCGEEAATIYGTTGNDDLDGTEGRDVVVLLAGDDRFDALGGDDLICGDEGIDTINGDAGADVMFGGDGNDIMSGGAGNDDMNGGAGNDVMNGGPGNDIMSGGAGIDSANGAQGTDTCDAETEIACEA
jgi:Ca2+-binding RTX toxin-like protein